MSRKVYDPLQFIPSPDIVREHLNETLQLAERLKVLLQVADRVREAGPGPIQTDSPVLDTLPTVEQVRDRLDATAAERRALRSLLRVLKQAALAKPKAKS